MRAGAGRSEKGAETRNTARKEKREEQGKACRYLGSGLEKDLGSRNRKNNQRRPPRGGEYGVILQRAKRLVCRKRKKEEGFRLGIDCEVRIKVRRAEHWADCPGRAKRPDPANLWRESRKEKVSL